MTEDHWKDVLLYFLDENEESCVREFDETDCGWQCLNDHTACMYNDGNNSCSHPGYSLTPLEDKEET